MVDTKNGETAAPQEAKTDNNDTSKKKLENKETSSFETLLQDMLVLQKVISFVKYMAVLLAVWFVGRVGFSFTWALIGTVAFFGWKNNQDEKSQNKKTGKALAENEEDVVRARLRDLPSWVSHFSWESFTQSIFDFFLTKLSCLCMGISIDYLFSYLSQYHI